MLDDNKREKIIFSDLLFSEPFVSEPSVSEPPVSDSLVSGSSISDSLIPKEKAPEPWWRKIAPIKLVYGLSIGLGAIYSGLFDTTEEYAKKRKKFWDIYDNSQRAFISELISNTLTFALTGILMFGFGLGGVASVFGIVFLGPLAPVITVVVGSVALAAITFTFSFVIYFAAQAIQALIRGKPVTLEEVWRDWFLGALKNSGYWLWSIIIPLLMLAIVAILPAVGVGVAVWLLAGVLNGLGCSFAAFVNVWIDFFGYKLWKAPSGTRGKVFLKAIVESIWAALFTFPITFLSGLAFRFASKWKIPSLGKTWSGIDHTFSFVLLVPAGLAISFLVNDVLFKVLPKGVRRFINNALVNRELRSTRERWESLSKNVSNERFNKFLEKEVKKGGAPISVIKKFIEMRVFKDPHCVKVEKNAVTLGDLGKGAKTVYIKVSPSQLEEIKAYAESLKAYTKAEASDTTSKTQALLNYFEKMNPRYKADKKVRETESESSEKEIKLSDLNTGQSFFGGNRTAAGHPQKNRVTGKGKEAKSRPHSSKG